MSNSERYILKQKLPGGHLKGDKFSSDGINERTGVKLTFKPEDEIEFFNIDSPPAFEKGNIVSINIKKSEVAKLHDIYGTRVGGQIMIHPYREYVVCERISARTLGTNMLRKIKDQYLIKGKGSTYNKYVLISESLLIVPTYYWFVNSSGEKIREIVGRFPKKEAFLKAIGNYHSSKIQLDIYLENLQDYHKKKSEQWK